MQAAGSQTYLIICYLSLNIKGPLWCTHMYMYTLHKMYTYNVKFQVVVLDVNNIEAFNNHFKTNHNTKMYFKLKIAVTMDQTRPGYNYVV